jgi:hypothetical protein
MPPAMPKPLNRRAMRELFSSDIKASKTPDADTRVWETDDGHVAVSRELGGKITIVVQAIEGRAAAGSAHLVAYAVFFEIVNCLAMPFERLEQGALRERHESTAYSFEMQPCGKMTDSLDYYRTWFEGRLPGVSERG